MAKRTIKSDLFGTKVQINSKTKGDNNERAVAKWFKEWTGADMNRTPRSGGLRWLDASRIAGDIVAPQDFYFPFCVEAKAYKTVEFKETLRVNTIVGKFWAQAHKDACRIDKSPLLIIRENGRKAGEFIIFVGGFPKEILTSFGISCLYSGKVLDSYGINELVYGFNSGDVIKVPYQDFIYKYRKQSGIE